MCQTVEGVNPRSASGLERGVDALRRSPEFRGPVEPLEDHEHANDHLALIYESREDQFAAAIPYVRQGLEHGERCVYITYENTREQVVEAMRAGGIDVDDALESGALSIHDERETYLRNGSFDPEDTLAFLDDAISEAKTEYEALRVTGEMSFILDDDADVDDLLACESKANYLFEDVDGMALCQYNRDRFPPEVIRDVINTHPYLIHDNRVSDNSYYTPPSEFLAPERPVREVERMLGTLREQTDVKAELEDRQQFLRGQIEILASTDQTFEEKLQALFELGQDRFDIELGALARVDTDADWFEVEYVSDDHENFEPGVELPLSETYCTAAADIRAAGSVADPHADGYDDIYVYQEFGIEAYLGTYIEVTGGTDRTFFFVTSEPQDEEFSADDRALIRLMGQWVKYELERRQRERFLQKSHEITSDPALDFETKLERLLEYGCEWLSLETAGLNHLPSWDGKFRLERSVGVGLEGEDAPVWTDPGEGCFCRQTITEDTPVTKYDVRGTEWADDPVHQTFGLTSYLGTKVSSGATPYGTLWFGSSEPRERPFSDTERAFIDQIGQWISYEIERREHRRSQRELYEIAADTTRSFDEKLQALFDLGCDRFDLELGGMARIDPDTDEFEVEHVNGDNEHLQPGAQIALTETYCRVFTDGDEMTGITDPVDDGFEGTRAYEEFGMNAYFGTRIELADACDRTLFFVASEPRTADFSEAERTFLQLMGQWVQHELEQQRRERKLRERTQHLSALIETTPECIKTVAADGTLLQMNPAGLEMVEAEAASDVTGESVYGLIAPEDRERFREFNERICRGERGTLEFDIIGLDGTRRHMETHAAPLRRPDGTVSQVALTRDVTEQVERKQRLEETVEKLQQSNDRLKQFAYAASHDLQEPLRMVSSYLQLLENRYRDDLDEEACEYIDFAVDGADRMRAMVDDLLAYSRVEQADGEFESVECDTVLEQVVNDHQVQIEQNGAEIDAESLPTVVGDSKQLTQLFGNLISNAVKYNDADPPRVEITADRRSDHWEFSVADNGIGIAPDNTDRIFEVFKRLHHDGEYSGTGIGLPLCQEIVENHGGDIWVESEPGEGSTFFFTLPEPATN